MAAITNGHHNDPITSPGEKSFSSIEKEAEEYHSDGVSTPHGEAIKRIRSARSLSISPELFEKLYLSPPNAVKGDLRSTFGNPTPICLIGFLISCHPLGCDLMGWRGAGGAGAAGIGSYYFFGGLLMTVGGVMEFLLGNTFPFVVFMSFGSFWLTLASTLQPFYMAFGSYAPPGGTVADGLTTVGFTASFGFFLLFMGVMCIIYLICSLRTNIVFVIIFFGLAMTFFLLTGSYWQNANAIGNQDAAAAAIAGKLQIAAGAWAFVACMAGWYIFASIMFASLDFPFSLPVGDLSSVFKSGTERRKMKENMV